MVKSYYPSATMRCCTARPTKPVAPVSSTRFCLTAIYKSLQVEPLPTLLSAQTTNPHTPLGAQATSPHLHNPLGARAAGPHLASLPAPPRLCDREERGGKQSTFQTTLHQPSSDKKSIIMPIYPYPHGF